jgi:branched-chain amino acid transport system permease protein
VQRPLAIFAFVAMFVAFYALPFAFPNQPYVFHIFTLTLCYAISAIGLNLLFGYTGLVSLGHMGFAGIGAYTTALLYKQGHRRLRAGARRWRGHRGHRWHIW